MTDTARARKLADRIRVVVAETLQRRIKDPRLGYVTITDTRVTGDLREATVFYTVYGDDEERAASAAALESAKGVLRSEVGRQTGVRFTPTLAFVADALPDNARTIDDLLAKARAADEEVRKAATDKQYAGEADPYRKPADDEDDEATTAAGRTPRAGTDGRGTTTRTVHRRHDAKHRPLRAGHRRQARRAHLARGRSRGCGGWPAPGGSATPAPWTRWRPACWSSASRRPPGCSGHLALTEKEYVATIRLGQTTVTDDAEGEVTAPPSGGRGHPGGGATPGSPR